MKRRIQVVCGVFSRLQEGVPEVALFMRSEPVQEYEFPGGKIELGESPQQALQRELEEELGVLTKVGDLIGKNTHEYENLIVDIQAFMIKPGSFNFQMREHLGMVWVTTETWTNHKIVAADLPLIPMVFDRIKG